MAFLYPFPPALQSRSQVVEKIVKAAETESRLPNRSPAALWIGAKMTDRHPDTFELEIDRHALRRYLRTLWFVGWISSIGFVVVLLSLSAGIDYQEIESLPDLAASLALGLGRGLAISIALSTLLYLALSHRRAAAYAENQRVIVEGAFLRIIDGGRTRTDRKLHFRSIVDYATIEGPLMRRFGLMALQITTTGGGASSVVRIPGILRCEQMRDTLAEIDAARELG